MSSDSGWKRFAKIKPTKKSIEKRAAKAERATLRHARRFIVNRWDNLLESRREVIGWLCLVAVLIAIGVIQMISYANSYSQVQATSGGTYAEGITGNVVSIDPIFAATDNEKAVEHLVYDGLFSYDTTNHLRGDLATGWSVSEDGKTYTVDIRKGVKWQDGRDVSADDVVFTIDMIKNPKVGSPLYESWRTISVAKQGSDKVVFTLQTPFAPFPYALTFGVIPQHLYSDVHPEQLREHLAASRQIGTGPFVYRNLRKPADGQTIFYFDKNPNYYRHAPLVDMVQIHTYPNDKALADGYLHGEVNAAAGISSLSAARIKSQSNESKLSQATLDDGVFAMFNTTTGVLSDENVREALRAGTNRDEVRKAAAQQLSIPVTLDRPIVDGIYNSVDSLAQPGYDEALAKKTLDDDGWTAGNDGVRTKDGEKLKLTMVTLKNADYEAAAKNLAQQWKKIGVDVEFVSADPETVQQNYFIPRAYDVLVYQLQLGADSDVFAYWHSTQANARGLNLANYKSSVADNALVSGRTRTSSELRDAKYKLFVETWLDDVPAIALYQPSYYYASAPGVAALGGDPLVNPAYRFRDVINWTASQRNLNTTP